MREQLHDGPPDPHQACMKLLLNRVKIYRGEIRVSGSKTALERLAARRAPSSLSEVLSFAQKWRANGDESGHWLLIVPMAA